MRRVFVGLVVLVALLAFGYFWWSLSLQPVKAGDKTTKIFVVDKGVGIRDLANKLKEQGLIKDQVAFFLLVKFQGLEKKIQAGDFRLSPGMSAYGVASALTHGTLDVWITIPEGWRAEEIFAELVGSGALASQSADPAVFKASEGRLFPDTYLIPRDSDSSKIIKMFEDNFNKKVTPQMLSDANKENLDLTKLLTLASLVEREGKNDADRPIIADILLKRLKENMALQVDATVQYAIGKTQGDGWWPKELTTEDLQFRSPYNTYLYPGLPPGPICNPGLAAIKAVIYPAKTPYYYYLSDKNGVTHFAKTLQEHNANVAKYL